MAMDTFGAEVSALARINSSWKTQRNCPVLWNPAEEDLGKSIYGKSRFI
jgi:hypothetical protein